MAMQESLERPNSEATFTSPFGYLEKDRAETPTFSEVRVEDGAIKLPPEALNILTSTLHELPVHKHLQELKSADPETYKHSLNVAMNTLALGWINRDLEDITAADMKLMLKAALLHDVGKLNLDEVHQVDPETGQQTDEMVKLHMVNRRFTDEERKAASRHAIFSVARLQERHHIDDPLVLSMIALHHQIQENPTMTQGDAGAILDDMGLSEEDKQKVHKFVQKLETADKFDAKVTNRPDMPAASPQETRDYLYSQFDKYGGDKGYAYQITSLYYPELNHGQGGK